jgi:hypothetical protein
MWIRGKSLYTNRKVRRERDSNPRGLGGPCGFQVRRLTCCPVSAGAVLNTNHDTAVELRVAWYLLVSSGWGYRWGYAASPNWGTDSRDAIFQSSPAVPLSEGAQMAEQRQISRHAHAVDEMGTHRSAPVRSASRTRGCSNLPSRRRSWATCLPGNHSRETTSGFPRAQRAGPGREGLRLLLRSRSRRRRESRQKAWCSGGAVGAGWVVVAEACWHGRARLVRWSWPC